MCPVEMKIMLIEIVIDGANVAFINETKKRSVRRIEIAIGQLDPKADCVIAVLPRFWLQKTEKWIEDPGILKKLVYRGKIKLVCGNDDYWMIKYCVQKNAYLLTNDKLKDHRKKDWWTSEHEEWARKHLLDYEIINDTFLLSEKSEKLIKQSQIDLQNTTDQPEIEVACN